jgi:1-aminocyclopropane-1-carboxylate deaminase
MTNYSKFIKRSRVEQFTFHNQNNSNEMLFVKRDDLIHDEISGNKFRKLKYNIESARMHGCDTIKSFGGAFSNHLLALASLGKIEGINTIGVVRGDELNQQSNKLLERCADLGMRLEFVSRSQFKVAKSLNGVVDDPSIFCGPEGGANKEGVLGCEDIINETTNDYDYIVVAQGTCATSLGIYSAMSYKSRLVVVPVLKGFDAIGEMQILARKAGISFDRNRVDVLDQYHFGGYAKTTTELDLFIASFNSQSQFIVEPTYTGKTLYALNEFLAKQEGTKKVLFVHTGGLYHFKNGNTAI